MITVIKPGFQTTIQDLGRYGFQKFGVLVNGATDTYSHRLANLLVGNNEADPTLEATLIGPHLHFKADTVIAVGGADLSPALDGMPLRMWKPYTIKCGQELTFGAIRSGCRAYIAVAGGFQVPAVMKSASTYLRGNLGGFKGRALQKGDQLTFGSAVSNSKQNVSWSIADTLLPHFTNNPVIQVMKGRQYERFRPDSQHALFNGSFEITHQSDRMGYRLKGPALQLKAATEMLSEAVTYGTIQVPSDGNPIILLADRQTTGGYPKIAQIASVDFSKIAQTKPGDKIRFKEISHEEAQQQYLQLEKHIHYMKQGILLKRK